ncbi:MAG: chemotaxis protein CheW, partial [Deferribacteres bacterium]|nr:chemotaxis protein CheW [Deferribacteres bacterium]
MLKASNGEDGVVEEEVLQLVGFEIGEEEFGVDIHYVKEIIELP